MNVSKIYLQLRKFYETTFPQIHYYGKDLHIFGDLSPILDIGCGHGLFIESSAERIIGLDQNPDSVAICKQKGLNVTEGTCLSLPFESGSMAGVYCSHLIEHLNWEEAQRMIIEIDRVLRVGGRVVIKTPLPNAHFYDDPTHVKPYPPSAVISFFGNGTGQQTLTSNVHGNYKFISISWDRALLYESLIPPSCDPGRYWIQLLFRGIGIFLAQFGIRRFRKVAYTITLEKIGDSS